MDENKENNENINPDKSLLSKASCLFGVGDKGKKEEKEKKEKEKARIEKEKEKKGNSNSKKKEKKVIFTRSVLTKKGVFFKGNVCLLSLLGVGEIKEFFKKGYIRKV